MINKFTGRAAGIRLLVLLLALSSAQLGAASIQHPQPDLWTYEDAKLQIKITARPPEGTAAFYEARGFALKATELFASKCFLTISMRNKLYPVLWLEPARWRVLHNGATIQRYPISYWQQQFDQLQVPYATRAAFRWTQLPEQRDLRTDEPVGGNITLPPLAGPFTLVMHFDIGRQRDDKLELRFPQLHCVGRN